jgi:hypothetical protein
MLEKLRVRRDEVGIGRRKTSSASFYENGEAKLKA